MKPKQLITLGIVAVVLAVIWIVLPKPTTPVVTPPPTPNAEVTVDAPQPNAVVTSPLTVTGQALGNWYFEASFPVKLLDANGTVLAQGPAQAQGDWMTTSSVPFSITLKFTKPTTPTGTLVLKNDNPSGDPARDKEFKVPVRFASAGSARAGQLGAPATLKIGDTVDFSGNPQATLFRIDDSRCKPGVQCIWAGELAAVLHLTIGGTSLSSETILGQLTRKSATVGGYTFTLQSITETSATIVVAKAATAASRVSGYVHSGPTCPVEKNPPDPACADKPVVGATVAFWHGASTVADVLTTTDASGHFSGSIDPGTYRVTAGLASALPRCTEQQVTVKAGVETKIDISCDSGIR